MIDASQLVDLNNPLRAKRWEHLTKRKDGSFYEDVKDGFARFTIETLLDNTCDAAKKLWGVNEASTIASPGLATFTTQALPLVRRIYSRMIGRELAAVQPMTGPTAKVFTLDFYRNTGGTLLNDRSGTARDYAADPGEATSGIKEINVGLAAVTVTATSKKIKSKISLEIMQDMQSQFGLSANGELIRVMSDEIAREIDETIIFNIVQGASAGVVTWNSTPSSTDPTEVRAHKETLFEAIVDANNLVYNGLYRDATFIIGGVAAIARLEKLEEFKYIKGADQNVSSIGRKVVGVLNGRYQVIKDPWFPVENRLVVGFKGDSWLEVGFVYAPYIPYLTVTPFTNPDDLTITRAAMSRQAFKMINGGAYATLNIVSS